MTVQIDNPHDFAQDWWLFKGMYPSISYQHGKLTNKVSALTHRDCKLEIAPLTLEIETFRARCAELGYPEDKPLPVETDMIDKMLELHNLEAGNHVE